MKFFKNVFAVIVLVSTFCSAEKDDPGLREFESRRGREEFEIPVDKRKQEIVALVKKGIEFLSTHRPEEAFNAFMNDRRFVHGEVQLFVFDTKGTVYVHDDLSNIWRSFKDFRNAHGIAVIDFLGDKATKGGGWVEYEWGGDYKSSYVERVEKDGIFYIIGAGWYPALKQRAVENLVKASTAFFRSQGREKAFHEFSNKVGIFVKGDLYLYAYDSKGYCVAHGDNTALIGRNLINLKDDHGLFVIQALLKKADEGGGWVSYTWKNAPKQGYVEKVIDDSGWYMIGSGYYPEGNRTTVVDLVKRGVKYFNSFGREKSGAQFSYKIGEYVYGDLALFMYDFNGKVLGSGDNPELVGQNLSDLRAPTGEFVVKNLIAMADKGSGFINYAWKNDFIDAYVERVNDKQGNYLVGCGFYPDSKRERVMHLVKLAVGYLKNHAKDVALREFARRGGPFIRGDLQLFMFNFSGDCLVYGDNYSMVWKNFKKFKDSEGKQVISLLMHKAQTGGGWVEYKSRNAIKMSYVEKVEKDGVQYLIGSAFYK